MTIIEQFACVNNWLYHQRKIIFFSKNQQPAIWEGMSSTKFCEDYGSIYWLMKWRTFTNRSEIGETNYFLFSPTTSNFYNNISRSSWMSFYRVAILYTKPKSNLAKNLNDLDILGKGAALNFRQFSSIVISLKSRQSSYYIVFWFFLDRFLNEDKFLDVD